MSLYVRTQYIDGFKIASIEEIFQAGADEVTHAVFRSKNGKYTAEVPYGTVQACNTEIGDFYCCCAGSGQETGWTMKPAHFKQAYTNLKKAKKQVASRPKSAVES